MTEEDKDFLVLQEDLEADNVVVSMMMDTSSGEDELPSQRKGKSPNKKRDFILAHTELVKQYFNGIESIYSEAYF